MLDIAILDGVRTPFTRAYGPLGHVPAQELGRHAAAAAMQRAQMPPEQIEQVVFGNAAIPPDAPNIARVIALMAGIPQDRIAHTVHRNCASGMEAVTQAAQLVQLGEAKVVLAGGAESMTRIPLLYNDDAVKRFLDLMGAKSFWQRLRAFLRFRPRHLLQPVLAVKQGLTDPVSGLLMGETAEVLADDFGITREQQDEFALESHRRAVDAQKREAHADEIAPLTTNGQAVTQDVGPRANQSMQALAKLKCVFREGGTLTVGNSCGLTDGAAVVVVMPGEAARAEGRRPLGYIRGYAYAGCDPRRMGLGPVYATNKLLQKSGLAMKDIDLVEMNEAFAAQVIANERAFASDQFAQKELGRSTALGELDRSRLNVNGGAIALGHPVGATGTRLVLTLLKELRHRGLQRGIATLCIGGGQGGAVLVEAA